jgi:D-lactate dehydrogenase
MKIVFFSARRYDQESFLKEKARHELLKEIEFVFHDFRLNTQTLSSVQGAQCVCAFVNDTLDQACLEGLKKHGVRHILLRCAGYNNVDLVAAKALGLRVARVPAYSPYAVAEHTLGLLLTLNRKIHKAYNRVREGNYSIEGLVGFDVHGKTVGLIGLGKIGLVFAQTLKAMGCRVLGYDPFPSQAAQALGIEFVDLKTCLSQSDILSLHCPLNSQTRHIINKDSLALTNKGVFIINTSRGALIDTTAIISALKSQHLGALAIDVYEEEGPLFFDDHSADILSDDQFARLSTFPNVLITGHQAYLTHEALSNIAESTLQNALALSQGLNCDNEVLE